jgi:cytochrome c peroxidase
MKSNSVLWAAGLAVAAFISSAAAGDPPEAAQPYPVATCRGEPCDAVIRGSFAFFDRTLHGLKGNGRSCADCHMPQDQFQLSPASVETRFKRLEWRRLWNPQADDPLFRPIDADDFRTRGEHASDFSNLRQNGLIRVVMPLPPNVRLIDPLTGQPSAETTVDVWRAVPTINDVKLTGPNNVISWPRGPNPAGGFQLDARMATLQEQALGALQNHAEIQNAPPERLLNDLASFQRLLFTNPRVRSLSDAISAGVAPLPDPDPKLNALETQGKIVFQRACAQCHGGPDQSTPISTPRPIVRYHDILSACPRPVDNMVPARYTFTPCPPRLQRNARIYQITLADGSITRRTSTDPGRGLLTGVLIPAAPPTDDWGKFDVPGLRGLRATAPYFHNNSADTLEAVVDHYVEFFKRVQAVAPPGTAPPISSTDGVNFDRALTPADRAPLIEYLKRL